MRRPSARLTGPVLAVSCLAALYFAAFVHYGILLEDEGLNLLQIARTFHGERPYLDFHTGYPPAGFYLNAALFRLFGESVIPVRVFLAAVNATSTALLFVLARRFASPALAAVVALGWAAYLPVFVGLFAAFNVPYPTWYATCAFLATQVAFDRHLATGRYRSLLVAGIAAGVAFSFKQNVGALAVLACGLTLALLRAGDWDRDRRLARVLLILGGTFLLAGFTVAVTTVEAFFILGPTLVLLVGRLLWARGRAPETGRLLPALAVVAAGALGVSLVWLVPFLAVLGVGGLMREIFLVGTDFDLVYATAYPIPLGFPAAWPALLSLALGSVALGGFVAERGSVRPRSVVVLVTAGGISMAVLLERWSRIPEGLARSIMLQVQQVGFFAAPLLGVVVAITWLRRVRRSETAFGSLNPRVLGLLVFALCMYAELYPRIDSTHLIVGLPSMLVLAAWAAERMAVAWAPTLRVHRRVLVGGMIVAGAALTLVAAIPNFAALVIRRDGGLHWRDRVAVDSSAAPVYLDAEHASDVRALNALLAYLRERLDPGEGLFGFPAVALVPYLLQHPSVTRHDYWFAGRPDHLEEAEVVRQLAASPPRFAITVNRNIGFFSNSARYYFILRAFMQQHYVTTARFGRYEVLARRDLATDSVVTRDYTPAVGGNLLPLLAEPLHESRRAAFATLLEHARSPDEFATLAAKAAPDEPSLILLLRASSESLHLRAVPFLVRTYEESRWRVRSEAALALNYVALYTAEHRYLLGRIAGEREPLPSDLVGLIDLETARRWLSGRQSRYQVGTFAAWLLLSVRDASAATLFHDVLQTTTRDPYLRLLLLHGLVELGRPEFLCTLVELLGDQRHEYQDAIPSLLIESAATHPAELALCLSLGIGDRRPRGREVSAWTAGTGRVTGAAPALREALRDPEPRVRIAAAWALGRLRDADARPMLDLLAAGDDARMRDFAVEALERLDGRGQ